MVGQTVSHYKILEKIGEVRLFLQSRTDETSSQSVLNYRI